MQIKYLSIKFTVYFGKNVFLERKDGKFINRFFEKISMIF